MRKTENNLFLALVFRTSASIIVLLGLLSSLEVFRGSIVYTQLLFFTFWANFFTFVFFILLTVKSAISLKKDGKEGNCFFYSKIYSSLVVYMFIVMFAFWIGIAPFVENTHELWRFSNFATHVTNPIVLLVDYTLFSRGGTIGKRQPLLYLIFPTVYAVVTTIMGFSGVEFVSPYFDYPHSFPYPFMDWSVLGGLTILTILATVAVFVATGYALYAIDKRRVQIKHAQNKIPITGEPLDDFIETAN